MSLVPFCFANDVTEPTTFEEALPLVKGLYSQGHASLDAARLEAEATVVETAKTNEVTQDFNSYKRETDATLSD